MRFFDQTFPLLVVHHAAQFDDREMGEMVEGYERYFRRNERYAVLVVSPGDFVSLDARDRRLIGNWVNAPRTRELSQKLCVGSASVVPSAIARGTLTALLWFWTPPCPLRAVSTVEEGIDFCVERLARAKVPLSRPAHALRSEVVGQLMSLGGFAPSLGLR